MYMDSIYHCIYCPMSLFCLSIIGSSKSMQLADGTELSRDLPDQTRLNTLANGENSTPLFFYQGC